MRTEIIAVDPHAPDPRVIERAAGVLRAGGLVAFPTETVYGLGALADDEAAIERIYAAKGRPSYNPLIAHVPDAAAARAIAGSWPDAAESLARAFWPGPLTLVVPRGPTLPLRLTAGLDRAAIRAPRHPVALALLRAVGRPVAAPSANPSTQLSPTRAEHVRKGLEGRVELILDGGPCAFGIESTVVDVSESPARLLRPGALAHAELARVVPGLLTREDEVRENGEARSSPGMDAKHYAPRASLRVLDRAAIDDEAARAQREGRVGAVLRASDARMSSEFRGEVRVLPDDPERYAAALFETLHALDDAGCRTILVASVPRDGAWLAVRDRLGRAGSK